MSERMPERSLASADILPHPTVGGKTRSPEETVLLSLSVVGTLCILPFAVAHLYQQNLAMGLACLAVLVLGSAAAIYVWRTGDIRLGGLMFTLVYMSGVLVTLYIGGASLVYWAYPAMAGAYFFVPVRLGTAINALTLLAMAPVLTAGLPDYELYRVLATLVTVNIITCLFASRMMSQRALLTRLAIHDPLTGVGNRRGLAARLRELLATNERRGVKVAMLLIDVDGFKDINDRAGHAKGDQLLVELASLIGSRIRLGDGLYRYGGDEFVVLLYDTTQQQAQGFAEQLRAIVAGPENELSQPVTVSVGVSQLQRGESEDEWLQRADRSLYAAKDAGRNTTRGA